MTSRGAFRLRPYQRDIAHELLVALADRTRLDLGLESPMGSGKTTICKAVASAMLGDRFRLVVVSAPLTSIVDAWARPQRGCMVAGTSVPAWSGPDDVRSPVRQAAAAQLADPQWWSIASGLYVATRQALCTQAATDALRASGADLSDVLAVADEAHHHNSTTLAGEHAAALRALGATVLLVSGTPWHERGSVFTASTHVVRLSAAALARERDPQGRAWAPTEWRVEQRHVGTAEDARAAVERAGGADDEIRRGPEAAAVCAKIVQDWVADGRPPAVVNLPWVSWRGAMERALREVAPDARILNLVGQPETAWQPVLRREADCKRYEDRTVDVVLSCARMNEGTDWPLCAAVYNVRVPNSAQLILQRWARAARRKWDVEGYPAAWADVQLMRFYVPRLTGEAADTAWEAHRDMALLLACYLEDYRTAVEWAGALGPERRDRMRGRRGDRGRTRPKPAVAELDPVEQARIRAHALAAASRPGVTLERVVSDLRKRHPGASPAQIKSLALSAIHGSDPALAERMSAAQAAAAQPGRSTMRVREDLAERFAAIADEFAHVAVSPRSDLLALAARFTAEDAEGVARRMSFKHPGRPDQPEADFEDLFGGVPVVRDRVRDIVRQRRVPADFPISGVLAIASIACAARLRSEFTHSNGAPISFYPHEFVVLAAESGAGKSAAMDDTGFLDLPGWVAWLESQTADEVYDDRAERRAAQRALTNGKSLAREDARRYERRLAQPHVTTPDPLTDDTSPAQFVRDAQASGFLALAVEEGKELLDAFVRGETETMGPLLMAWDGRRKNRRRVGDEREGRGTPRFPDLHAAGLVVVQPTVLRGKDQADRDRLREVSKRGLFPRAMLILPRDITADEELAPPDPLPGADERARAYFDLIRGLLRTQVGDHPLQPRAKGTDGEQTFGGWTVAWEPEAAALVSALDSEWRAKAAAGGAYHGDELRAPQARRLSHHASRVAVLLAVLRAGRLGPDIVVTADDAARASRFASGYLWPHADAVLGRACETPVESAMSAVWGHLVEQGAQTRRQLSRKFPKLDEGERAADRRTLLDAALDFLERRGKVEKEDQGRGSVLYKPLVGHPFADRNDAREAA